MTSIRVASAVELPPGKGKVLDVAGRRVTVFNRDGRFFATITRTSRRADNCDTSATCPVQGYRFDVYMEDSPAHLRHDGGCRVSVDDDGVWLAID